MIRDTVEHNWKTIDRLNILWNRKSPAIKRRSGKNWKEVKDFQPWVIREMRASGAVVYRLEPGKSLPSGTPDLLIIYKGETTFVELKVRKGALRAIQRVSARKLVKAGASVFVLTLTETGELQFTLQFP